MSDLETYILAMRAGHIDACIQIEQRYGLFGYPPEVVTVGLSAIDSGEDVYAAIDAYLAGEMG